MRLSRPGLGAFCLGVMAATGQVPLSLFPLGVAGLAGLIAVVSVAGSARGAAFRGWLGGAGWFLGSLYWIVDPFLVEPEKTLWMAPFAVVGLSFGLALFWGLAALAGYVGKPGSGVRVIGVVLGLSLAELARGYLLTGFPWALVGYIWADTPVAQWAAWVGPFGLSAMTLALSGMLAVALLGLNKLRHRRPAGREPHRASDSAGRPDAGCSDPKRAAILALSTTLVLLFAGALRDAAPMPPDRGATIRIVQPNAPQHLKWRPELAKVFFDRLLNATTAPSQNGAPPDLILWPETAITPWLNDAGPTLEVIADALPPNAEIVLGLRRYEGRRYYNSLILMDGSARPSALYDKEHLVPFGEYLPLGNFAARLGLHGLASEEGGGYSAGSARTLITTATTGRFLPLICYEAIFPQEMASDSGARPDWLAQLTNDAWFGTFAGPQQHLAQARFRAIEQGLPMLRAANTGISAIIDARGHVRAAIPLGQAGFVDATLPGALPPPLYARTGDLPLLLLLLVTGGALFLRRRRLGD